MKTSHGSVRRKRSRVTCVVIISIPLYLGERTSRGWSPSHRNQSTWQEELCKSGNSKLLTKAVERLNSDPLVKIGILYGEADIRVCGRTATFGVFCRRVGVPLIDGGTVRLPRIVGLGRALDMVLTGRAVSSDEALQWGLVTKVVDDGEGEPGIIRSLKANELKI
ncbi:enoyl-CoA hydratase/isomerase family protein [Ostertagia ostertagi]